MALDASKSTMPSNRKFVEQPNLKVGGHAARVVRVVDLGVQPQKPWGTQVKKPVNMVNITYELSHDFVVDEDGNIDENRPRWIDETLPLYPLTADRATSTARYRAIDPEEVAGGNFANIISFPCTVVVVHGKGKGKHEGKIFDNIGDVASATTIPGYVQPELKNPGVVFDLSEPDIEVFKSLPKRLQEKIVGNLNFQGSKLQALIAEAGLEISAPQEEVSEPQSNQEPAPSEPATPGFDDDMPW